MGWDGEVEAGGDGLRMTLLGSKSGPNTPANAEESKTTTRRMSGMRIPRSSGVNSPNTISAAATTPTVTNTAGPNLNTD